MQKGDEIRIVAPSQSYNPKKQGQYTLAQERLEELGYRVSFGAHVHDVAFLGTAHAKDRAKDITEAYADRNVKAIMAMNGGWSANEVLPFLDCSVIRDNPKPLVGYSDITVLLNAIWARTGVIGYLGPNFGTHGYDKLWEYTLENLEAVLRCSRKTFYPSDRWMSHGDHRPHLTEQWRALFPGTAEGILLGGNIGSFYLLQGTPYQPSFDQPFILALEEDSQASEFTAVEFARRLESILQLHGVRENIQGMLIGRFETGSVIEDELLMQIIEDKQLGIPVIAHMDFGHTIPMLTLPIGGKIRMHAQKVKPHLELLASAYAKV